MQIPHSRFSLPVEETFWNIMDVQFVEVAVMNAEDNSLVKGFSNQ